MKRITIKEIANKASVSIGTVDRVLHNRGDVASKTKELVLKIAKEGNYSTNVFARSLKLNRTITLAVLLPDDNEYWSTINKGLVSAAAEYESLGMTLEFYKFDRHDADSYQTKSKLMLNSHPDGVILAPLLEEETIEVCGELEKKQIPFVFVDSNIDSVGALSFIGQDSIRAGYLAAKLLNLGFPSGSLSFVARFHDFDSLNKTIEERIKGFRSYYEEHRFEENLIQEVNLSGDSSQFLKAIADREQSGLPVHIFVPNSRSHQLIGLLKEFSGAVRIVGFDLIEENRTCLQTDAIDFIIDQNPSRQGELAVQAFYNKLISNAKVNSNRLMPLEIFTKENLI